MMENTAPMGESTTTEESTDAVQVDHPAAQALLEAQAALAAKTSDLLTGYHDRIGEIREDDGLEDGPYSDHLTEEQKSEIVQTRKREAGQELHRTTVEQYELAFEEFASAAEKHVADLRESLFGLGEGGSAALSQAVNADGEQLLRIMELGELTGAHNIAKSAFAAAVVRGDAPEVIHAYLQKFPEAEALLRAYEQAPTQEWISTQKANITRNFQVMSDMIAYFEAGGVLCGSHHPLWDRGGGGGAS
jgi:hypothetical protein